MQIYPAIDLHAGQCVRLLRGEFSAVTVYGDNPLAVAQSFAAQGATWLHVVDLDGARDSQARQHDIIGQLAQDSGLKVQAGGGIRSSDDIQRLWDRGVHRAIVGSRAVTDPAMVADWIVQHGADRIVVALDVRFVDDEPVLAVKGWQENTSVLLWTLLRKLVPCGLRHLLCTDIRRDGTLSGPSLSLYGSIRSHFPQVDLQASGGISRLEDIQQLRTARMSGAIVGRALYEKSFTLAEALAC